MNNITPQFPLLIGKITMTMEEFYDGVLNAENQGKYTIPQTLAHLIGKYPPTTSKLKVKEVQGGLSYEVLDVNVAVSEQDLKDAPQLEEIWRRVTEVKTINNPSELENSSIYKVKLLLKEGTFTDRILLSDPLKCNVKPISEEFFVEKDFYSLMAYSYACVFGAKTAPDDYQGFQDFYGKYIYGITLEHKQNKIGLVWLDYIMHPPKGHLELGVHASAAGSRFAAFNTWEEGDLLTLTVMADGFEDLVLETTLQAMEPTEETNQRYFSALEKSKA